MSNILLCDNGLDQSLLSFSSCGAERKRHAGGEPEQSRNVLRMVR